MHYGMRMRDVARLTNVPRPTIDHYRIRGLLRARRTPSGDWDYPDETPRLVALIRSLTSMGQPLDAIRGILSTHSVDEIEERLQNLTGPEFRAWVEEVNGAASYRHDL